MEQFPLIEELSNTATRVCLNMSPDSTHRLFPLLQAGIFVRCSTGATVAAFLRDRLDLSTDYVEKQISTVFLNGKPVDDIENAVLEEASTLALSSAMPGLVGATMRRKGYYASLRSAITYVDRAGSLPVKEGLIRLKLFNVVMTDLGASLFRRGVVIDSPDFAQFLTRQDSRFFGAISKATVNDRAAEPTSLTTACTSLTSRWVELKACESP